jgi:hypothetical protein
MERVRTTDTPEISSEMLQSCTYLADFTMSPRQIIDECKHFLSSENFEDQIPKTRVNSITANGISYKCQKGWFTCVNGIAQFAMEHLQARAMEIPEEITTFIRKFSGQTGRETRPEDIEFGEQVLITVIALMEELDQGDFDEQMEECVNPEFFEEYKERVRAFFDKIHPGDTVILTHHNDSDGIVSAAFVNAFLKGKFGNSIEIIYTQELLSSKKLVGIARETGAKHLIATDLWIPNDQSEQESLQELLLNGVNILDLDHHDGLVQVVNPANEGIMEDRYDPSVPESLRCFIHPKNGNTFDYVSPTRLGSPLASGNFPAGFVTYKLLKDLGVDLSEHEELLFISASGDYSSEAWDGLLTKYPEKLRAKLFIGKLLNIAQNLKRPDDLVRYFTEKPHPLCLLDTIHGGKLIELKRWIDDKEKELRTRGVYDRATGQTKEFVVPGILLSQNFAYSHIAGEDLKHPLFQNSNGTLAPNPNLTAPLSDQILESFGAGTFVAATQFQGDQEAVAVSARDGQGHFIAERHVGHIMQELDPNGGGHPNAGGARIEVPEGRNPMAQLLVTRRKLEKILKTRGILTEDE